MIRRARRTLPATLVAIVLVVLGGLTATVAIQALLGRSTLVPLAPIADRLAATTWGSTVVLIVAAVVGVVGLLLLLGAVVPGRARMLPVGSGDDAISIGIHREDAARQLKARALAVPDVDRVAVKVSRTKVGVRVRFEPVRGDVERDRTVLEQTLNGAVEGLGLARTPKLRLRVDHPRED